VGRATPGPFPVAPYRSRAIRSARAGGRSAWEGRVAECVGVESSSWFQLIDSSKTSLQTMKYSLGSRLGFLRNAFVEHEHAMRRQVVVALQGGAGQKIVHRLVELNAHR